jgi:ABC-type transport system substrate-binding protein
MRSTRRISGLLVPIALLGAIAFGVAVAPEPPQEPRFAGAGHEEPQRGGSFVFFHESNVRSLDPHIAFDELSSMGLRLLFDGLLEYDERTELVPSLAGEMPMQSEDGLTFTFRLREGVLFHNGRELIAEDVRWSLEHMLSPDVPSPGAPYYSQLAGVDAYRSGDAEHVSGIRVVDDYTIELTLTAPDQTFLHAMAMHFAYPVPRENYEAHPDDVASHPVGTGPYVLDRWERGDRLLFDRNPSYWRPGKPYVDRMVYLENTGRDVAVMRFRNGDLDSVHRFSPADYLFFRNAEAWQPYLFLEPKVNLWGIAMNTGMEPFDDVHLRRAVAFAMDREGWSRARQGRYQPTGQPIPPQLLGYDPDLPTAHHFDIDRAREEMRLAGHPDGLPDEVLLWYSSGETGQYNAELAQADLARIGIRLRLNPVSFAAYLEETGKPRRAQMLLTGWNMDYPDPANFFDSLWHSRAIAEANSSNRSFYRNPALDALLDRARAERDPERRREMYREASIIVTEDAPWAFMWNDLFLEAVQPYVHGYFQHKVFAQEYRFVWLDLPRKPFAERHALVPAAARAALFPRGAF